MDMQMDRQAARAENTLRGAEQRSHQAAPREPGWGGFTCWAGPSDVEGVPEAWKGDKLFWLVAELRTRLLNS